MFTFFQDIIKALSQVLEFFKELFNIIEISIEFIPQPFLAITSTFLIIFIATLLYKIIKR